MRRIYTIGVLVFLTLICAIWGMLGSKENTILQNDLQTLEKKFEELQVTSNQNLEALDTSSQDLSRLKRNKESLATEFCTQKKAFEKINAEAASLAGALNNSEDQVTQLSGQLQKLTKNRDELAQQLNDRTAEFSQCRQRLADVEEREAVLGDEIVSLTAAFESNKEEMKNFISTLAKVIGERDLLQNSLNIKIAHFDKMEQQSQNVQAELEQSNQELDKVRANEKFFAEENVLQKNKIMNVKAQVGRLTRENEEKTKLVERLEIRLSKQTEAKTRLQEQLYLSTTDFMQLQEQQKKVHEELSNLQNETSGIITAMQIDLDNKNNKNVEITETLHKCWLTEKKLLAVLETSNNKVSEIQGDLHKTNLIVKELETKNIQQEHDLEDRRKDLLGSDVNRKVLISQISAQNKALKELNKTHADLERELASKFKLIAEQESLLKNQH